MTSTPHHLASMSSDEPRGYGAVGDARKRLEAQHQAHPDPAVRKLIADAWADGFERGHADGRAGRWDYDCAPNPHRSAS